MKIIVNNAPEYLSIMDRRQTDIEWTADFIEAGELPHDEDGNPIMTTEEYQYWQGEIELQEKIDSLLNDLESLGIDWCPTIKGAENDRDCTYARLRDLWVGEYNSRRIGQNISDAREAANLTQERLAGQVGTDKRMIIRYEAGEVNMTVNRLIEIADALHVGPDMLLDGVIK